ncbi:MAG TPA: sigma-70 family RNA polymerase sigma factor [Cyclobacteriaceae bacterium]|nr:sigma-70 family RNA polymerase sigma factor [Cyclobacteriaceae bacterium]HMV09140.1 sigma-70 family RNA polymerase sigma factor [Cyclobacteriaceae bacterium]HMX01491.1 sigma-70 family RNA polymerase sigma factor [Cyclobacteriaceae bacterium]HMX50239.1 sigma-70 family RNA polymerase sigma factor [Cyclobacteriaceae bacterium]HMY92307.1 sigma-70 family RNA polymerase sigma factor [Cyclobacteriaceae bacterium]
MDFKIYRANEQELIQGCRRGDRAAQKRLYDTFSPKMYALCCRYVKDSMEAEDVLVTAFTKILDKIDQYKSEGSFEGWIRRVVVNEALTWLRRNRNMYLELELEAADYEPDYKSLSDHLEAEDLMTMINELPSGYRIVFNLYAIDGYSHKEIADQLGISENTSKSQLSRARAYLQKLLTDNDWKSNQQRHDITT